MKRKLKYIAISFLALLLSLLTLVGGAAEPISANLLHYGIANTESNRTLSPSQLFERLFGEAPIASEAAYLDSISELTLTYNSAVPDSIVTTSYHGENGTLDVSLPAYCYTAQNGTRVEWIPQSASIGTQTANFTLADGVYHCLFTDLFYSGDFEMHVDFTWNATVPTEAVDALLTSAYTAAATANGVILEYERELAAYREARNKFLAYQAYEDALALYNNYVNVEKPAYDLAYAAYQDAKARYDQYTAKLASYEEWQHYWAYQEFMSGEVQEKYTAYQAYLSQIAPIKERLKIFDTLFVKDSRGWEFYASFMGGTVEQVLARKAELVSYFGKTAEDHINAAGQATKELKPLMKGYADLRNASYPSEHARLTALFNYYTANYAKMKTEFRNLFLALEYLGSKSPVIAALQSGGKMEHYFQFVGQLYITQACLDDSNTYSNVWWVYHRDYTLPKVVESLQRIEDTNRSDPTGIQMPDTEVPKVEKVEPIERPTVEEVREKPTMAEFGLTAVPVEPTAPTVYERPDEVPFAAEPEGDEPTFPAIDEKLLALTNDLRAGVLPEREATGRERTLTFTEQIVCPVSIRNLKKVTFYAADGKTVLDRQTLEYGSRIEYRGATNVYERPSDEKCHYTFLGWVILPEGTAPEMVANDNMSLYAAYHETPRFYTVTWVLDGQRRSESLQYGTIPRCPFSTEKAADAKFTYSFSGWDLEVGPITGDVTYTASFLPTLRQYTVRWIVGTGEFTQTLPYGTLPSFEGETAKPADSYRYEFAGWDKAVSDLREDVTYTAQYRKTALATDESGAVLPLTHGEEEITVTLSADRADVREAALLAIEQQKSLTVCHELYSLTLEVDALEQLCDSYCREVGFSNARQDGGATEMTVGYLNSVGKLVPLDVKAVIKPLTKGCYYADANGAWTPLDSEGMEITGSINLRICDVYGITVHSDEPINLLRFPRVLEGGSIVDLSLIGCEFGYEITAAELCFADGTRQTVTGGSFVMPNAEVTLELTVKRIVYRVSFVVDGAVWQSAEYFMGEEILLPEAPTKQADESFSYTFKGWTPTVGIAYGEDRDLVFEAEFSTTPIGSTFVADRSLFYRLLYIAIGAVVLLIALAVTLIILLRKRARKKKKAAAQGLTAGESDASASIEQVAEPIQEEIPTEQAPVSEQTDGESSEALSAVAVDSDRDSE